jgi:hypothetical protein
VAAFIWGVEARPFSSFANFRMMSETMALLLASIDETDRLIRDSLPIRIVGPGSKSAMSACRADSCRREMICIKVF